jgi:hypothetical protein
MWFGADPGGEDRFGVASLRADGSFDTWCCSSVDDAVRLIDSPRAIGIEVQCGGRRLPVGVDGWILGSEKRTAFPPVQSNR